MQSVQRQQFRNILYNFIAYTLPLHPVSHARYALNMTQYNTNIDVQLRFLWTISLCNLSRSVLVIYIYICIWKDVNHRNIFTILLNHDFDIGEVLVFFSRSSITSPYITMISQKSKYVVRFLSVVWMHAGLMLSVFVYMSTNYRHNKPEQHEIG